MDVLTFLSSLVNSLAWPVAVLGVVMILKDKIGTMLKNAGPLKRFKAGAGGVELEYFDDTLAEARRDLPSVSKVAAEEGDGDTSTVRSGHSLDDFTVEMERLAKVSPRAVVLESFTRLEAQMQRELSRAEESESRNHRVSVRSLAVSAVKAGLLSPNELSAFDDVRTLRNLVAHDPGEFVDEKRAVEYAQLVRQIAIAINVGLGKTILDDPEF